LPEDKELYEEVEEVPVERFPQQPGEGLQYVLLLLIGYLHKSYEKLKRLVIYQTIKAFWISKNNVNIMLINYTKSIAKCT